MKTLMVHINDDSKVQLFVNFLREISFVKIEEMESPVSKTKKMTELPKSVLHPVRTEQQDNTQERKNRFLSSVKKHKFSLPSDYRFDREELHER